jgi:trehalose-phosphatase
MSAPIHLSQAWPRLRRELGRAGRFALFSDFDGTLAPIRARPEQVRMPRRTRALLEAIAGRGHVVGIISGRALEDVRRCAGVRGVWYAGAHGHFLCAPDGRTVSLAGAGVRGAVRQVFRSVRAALRRARDVRVENKIAGVAVHVRGASKKSSARAEQVVRAAARASRGFEILRGKKILELVPAGGADKWSAVRAILARERARRAVALYLGDDTTDESVFRRLRGISVAVGKRRRTAATFFLRSPADVRRFLERLNRWRP